MRPPHTPLDTPTRRRTIAAITSLSIAAVNAFATFTATTIRMTFTIIIIMLVSGGGGMVIMLMVMMSDSNTLGGNRVRGGGVTMCVCFCVEVRRAARVGRRRDGIITGSRTCHSTMTSMMH
jgi:hypothetical protein